jgi:apolipoprotein N-acyltransferase
MLHGFVLGVLGSWYVITERELFVPIIALAVFLVTLIQPTRRGQYLGMFGGAMVVWGVSQWWTFQVASLGFVPLLMVQASWLVLTAWSLRRVCVAFGWRRMLVAAPVVMTGIEFLRCEVFMGGYAWGFQANWVIDTAFARVAPIAGVYGVGFAVCALASIIAFVLAKYCHSWTFARFSLPEEAPATPGQDQRNRTIMLASLFAIVPVFVVLLIGAPQAVETFNNIRIASVQTNISQSNKTYWTLEQEIRDYRRMQELNEKAAGAVVVPKLIVWPETMMPGISIEPAVVAEMKAKELVFNLKEPMPAELGTNETRVKATAFWEALSAMSVRTQVPMLIGEEGLEGFTIKVDDKGAVEMDQRARFNSAYLVRDGEVVGERYDKMELTPFGEYMPVISRFPWLEKQLLSLAAEGMSFDLSAGTKKVVFPIANGESEVRVVTPICFEITESTVCRGLVFDGDKRRADVMINLSNDGWFQGSDAAREQHLRIARWRCLELGTPMVRSANTGISAVIDANGRVVARGVEGDKVGCEVEGVMAADVPLPMRADGGGATFYARTGNWAGWGSMGIWVIVTGAAVVRCRKLRKSA